jgi:hypothetical protein
VSTLKKKPPLIAGKPAVLKTREDEEQLVMDWLNMQTMYSDSIRYLIQKEIAENGMRNLQLFIPHFRTIESLKTQLAVAQTPGSVLQNTTEQSYIAAQPSPAPNYINGQPARVSTATVIPQENSLESKVVESAAGSAITASQQLNGTRSQDNSSEPPSELTNNKQNQGPAFTAQESPNDSSRADKDQELQRKDEVGPDTTQKRKGKKKFDSDVINSFAN